MVNKSESIYSHCLTSCVIFTNGHFVATNQIMKYEWDEHKRLSNIDKHGLDFADAKLVYENRYRFEIYVEQGGEKRVMLFAYVFDHLAVLTLVITRRGKCIRCISYRRAHEDEREAYHEWLSNCFKE